ncbi:MAG: alpha/beta hydrolase [Acidimicrobiales bacterium]
MAERSYDPELAPVVPLLPTGFAMHDPEEMRRQVLGLREPLDTDPALPDVIWTDRMIPGPPGSPDVAVRVYRPEATGTLPAVVEIHGGGFVAGTVDMVHPLSVAFARRAEAVVVSVEYRRAPEHRFPAALDDCYAALEWTSAAAGELGVDRSRVAIIGQSAGAGLAAAVALRARDRNGPPLCLQVLEIPELDDRLETVSMRELTETPVWSRANAEWSWRHYLGPDITEVSPYAAPARAEDLTGLPSAYVSTMEYDPLRDEGIIYALRLLQAGVTVELHSFPGTFHASALIDSAVSRRAADEVIGALRRAFQAL